MSEDPINSSASPESEKQPAPVVPYSASTPVLQYSSAATSPPDDWVNVFRARDYLEANLLVGKLQEQGIHARVESENVAAIGSWAGGGPGGAGVQVLSGEAAQAREIIDELERIRAARHAPNRVPCPRCQHTPSTRMFRPSRVAATVAIAMGMIVGPLIASGPLPKALLPWLPFALLGLGVALLMIPALPRWRCPACGHQWAQAEPQEEEEDDQQDEDNDEDEQAD